MTNSKIKKAIEDRKHFKPEKHSRLWELCQRRLLPLSREQDRMDAKWGFGSLPRLVSLDLSKKWATTQDNLWRALDDADAPEADEQKVFANIDACAQSCLRGLEIMDREAHKLHPNGVAPPESFEWNKDGQHFVVVADGLKAAFLPDGIRIVTMEEVAAALAYREATELVEARVQEHFPDAQVTSVRPKALDQEIPF